MITSPVQLHQLETKSSIDLKVNPFNHTDLELLAKFIISHGHRLKSLQAALEFGGAPYHHDWLSLDFTQVCPHLTMLSLERIDVNESILALPHLTHLQLTACYIHSAEKITLRAPLEQVELEDVNWAQKPTLIAMQHPTLRQFNYSLDEDSVETVPQKFIFEACAHLSEVGLHIAGGGWEVELKGVLPELKLSASSGRFGFHSVDVSAVADGSHPDLINLRDGVGSLSAEVIAFTQTSKHFNLPKAIQAVRLLGGQVADSPTAENVTMLVIGNQATFDTTPYESLEIILESDFRDVIYEWY